MPRNAGDGAAAPPLPPEVSALQYRPAKATVAPAGMVSWASLELIVAASLSMSTYAIVQLPLRWLVFVEVPARAWVQVAPVAGQLSRVFAATATSPRVEVS